MFDSPLYHLIFLESRRAVYAPVPKAACSSFKAWLRALDGLPSIPVEALHFRRTNGLVYAQAIERERLLRLLLGGPEVFKFTVVRNPYARLVSAFADLLQPDSEGRCRLQKEADRLLEHRRRLIDARPSECDRLSFETFVELLPRLDPRDMNRHWQPQSIITLSDILTYDLVAKLERLGDALPRILAALKTERPFDLHLNASAPADLGDWYTPKLAAIVAEVYADDFQRFGYDLLFQGAGGGSSR